jgi:Transglycosylase
VKRGDAVSVTSVAAVAPARGSVGHPVGSRWTRRVILLLTCGGIVAVASVLAALLAVAEIHHVYFSRHNLPDLGPFTRFEFPTIGHVYDASGRPLIELAREYREIARYEDIPPIVRDAILSAEDKRFFSHNGIDYVTIPRVLGKVRVGMLAGRLLRAAVTTSCAAQRCFRKAAPRLPSNSCAATFSASRQRRRTVTSLATLGSWRVCCRRSWAREA